MLRLLSLICFKIFCSEGRCCLCIQDRREDTLLELAHFRRHKRKTLKKQAGKSTTFPFHKPEEHTPAGKDLSRKIPKLIGKAARYAGSAKPKKVKALTKREVPT